VEKKSGGARPLRKRGRKPFHCRTGKIRGSSKTIIQKRIYGWKDGERGKKK